VLANKICVEVLYGKGVMEDCNKDLSEEALGRTSKNLRTFH
jgi:hypothetical protein